MWLHYKPAAVAQGQTLPNPHNTLLDGVAAGTLISATMGPLPPAPAGSLVTASGVSELWTSICEQLGLPHLGAEVLLGVRLDTKDSLRRQP